jgi:hypothetical protein
LCFVFFDSTKKPAPGQNNSKSENYYNKNLFHSLIILQEYGK